MPNPPSIPSLAEQALERCDHLGRFTEEPGKITRTFLSPPMRDVHREVRRWMMAAGLAVRIDPMGNIVGQTDGTAPNTPVLLIGSHLDTVPDAGRYDGILGVMLGIAVVEALNHRRLPFAIEVVGFSEEEGVRFKTPYFGSKSFTNTLEPRLLDVRDSAGISVGEAASAFGLSANSSPLDPSRYLAYIEPHIEQGPVLESAARPLGVVRTIVGQSRWTVSFTGRAAHAGTTPMTARHDALVAAARLIDHVCAFATGEAGLTATVGRIEAHPNASNVIPGHAQLSLDVRHADDDTRTAALQAILDRARAIATQAACTLQATPDSEYASVPMDPHVTRLLADAVHHITGDPPLMLDSGAGHDAAILAPLVPSAMLFLRSPGGISHHPDESVQPGDVELALAVLIQFIEHLAQSRKVST
ncbi:MAG TPA: allantoate amidohydrolase [Tepidisphaeraceae bacterium]|jgi:allantoate deiminase